MRIVNGQTPSKTIQKWLKRLVLLSSLGIAALYVQTYFREHQKLGETQKIIHSSHYLALAQGLYREAFQALPPNSVSVVLDSKEKTLFQSPQSPTWGLVCRAQNLMERNATWTLCSDMTITHLQYVSLMGLLLAIYFSIHTIESWLGKRITLKLRPLLGVTPLNNSHSAESLDHLVVDLADSLQKLQNMRQTEAVIQAQALAAKQLSHDLASPIAAIKLCISGVTHQSEEHREVLMGAVQRLDEIVRISRKKMMIKSNDFQDIQGHAVTLISKQVQQLIQEKEITLALPSGSIAWTSALTASSPTMVKTSLPRLMRALSNFLDNALEACDYDGTRIGVSLIHPPNTPDGITIRIQDSGGGIAEEVLMQIRAGKTMTTKSHGNGLGLMSSVQYIAETGGAVRLGNIQLGGNLGAQIDIDLPAAPPLQLLEVPS